MRARRRSAVLTRTGCLEVRPRDPDAHPSGDLADQLLATLLAHAGTASRLSPASAEPLVLDLAVELEEHPELAPHEVGDAEQAAVLVEHLDLRLGPGKSAARGRGASPRLGHVESPVVARDSTMRTFRLFGPASAALLRRTKSPCEAWPRPTPCTPRPRSDLWRASTRSSRMTARGRFIDRDRCRRWTTPRPRQHARCWTTPLRAVRSAIGPRDVDLRRGHAPERDLRLAPVRPGWVSTAASVRSAQHRPRPDAVGRRHRGRCQQ